MNKHRILGFCNLHSSPYIDGLNDKRALGAVTFLGRYALMDFTLSNFANSGIDNVCILVHHYPHSVIAHVGNGDVWTANTKTGVENIFFNEFGVAVDDKNTDINNILANKVALSQLKYKFDYIVVAPAHYLSNMDFNKVIEEHERVNAKVSCVYVPIHEGKTKFKNSYTIQVDKDGNVIKHGPNTKRKDDINVALNTFVFNSEVFDLMIRKANHIDETYSISHMIRWMMENEGLKVHAYRFEHAVVPITSMDEYIQYSFALLDYENRRKIFREDWPVYTRTHNTPPALYGDSAKVKDSIVSNGCVIEGTVEHSILSRNVVIEKGAHVKDCIVFTKSIIKKGVNVQNIITDKSVVISKDLGGKEEPVFVRFGSKI